MIRGSCRRQEKTAGCDGCDAPLCVRHNSHVSTLTRSTVDGTLAEKRAVSRIVRFRSVPRYASSRLLDYDRHRQQQRLGCGSLSYCAQLQVACFDAPPHLTLPEELRQCGGCGPVQRGPRPLCVCRFQRAVPLVSRSRHALYARSDGQTSATSLCWRRRRKRRHP